MDDSYAGVFDSLFDRRCTSVYSNVGSMVAIDLSKPDTLYLAGHRTLFIYFGEWVLRRSGQVVTSWKRPRDHLVENIQVIEGRTIERFGVHEESGACKCWFDQGLTLTVRPCTYDADASWWQISDEQGLLVKVGPGPSYSGP